MRGALVHDFIYQMMRNNLVDRQRWRKPADKLLQQMCAQDGMWRPVAGLVYGGVRIFARRRDIPASASRYTIRANTHVVPSFKLKPLPPRQAVAFFRQKGYKIGFDYRDVWRSEHQAAFTVAKVMKLDLLRDIRAAVDKALADGVPFEQFRDELQPQLMSKGWWGRAPLKDPLTGEVGEVATGLDKSLAHNLQYQYQPSALRRPMASDPRSKNRISLFTIRRQQLGRAAPHA